MSKYDYDLELNENSSTGQIIREIAPKSVVLEFGCAAGRMTEYMSNVLDCKVYIVEYCKEDYAKAITYAVDGVCGDITEFKWLDKFSNVQFDYIIFADVLEHLLDPARVLSKCKSLLKDDGKLIFSVPNIAHNDIIASLIEDKFRYTSIGLLDNTHIHFFAYNEIEPLIQSCGYSVVQEGATSTHEFCTEQADVVDNKDSVLYKYMAKYRPLSKVYQYVFVLQKQDYVLSHKIKKLSHIDTHIPFTNITVSSDKGSTTMYPKSTIGNTYTYTLSFKSPTQFFTVSLDSLEDSCIISNISVDDSVVTFSSNNGSVLDDTIYFDLGKPSFNVSLDSKVAKCSLSFDITIVLCNAEKKILNKAFSKSYIDSVVHDYNLKLKDATNKIDCLDYELGVLKEQVISLGDEPNSNFVRNNPTPTYVATDREYAIYNNVLISPSIARYPYKVIETYAQSKMSLDLIPCTKLLGGSVAVQVHLYYIDLIPEFFDYLNNIPYPFDLYISCQETADTKYIAEWFSRLRYVKDIIVRKSPNVGRDIAPVFSLFAREIMSHDYFCHFHTKKSLYTGKEQSWWRKYCMDTILGSEEQVMKVFSLLNSDKYIGMVYPENRLGYNLKSWLGNVAIGKEFTSRLGIPFVDPDIMFDYPVGSFYWARTKALSKIFDLGLTYEDFGAEQGQIDGTIAHAIERCVALSSLDAGYHNAIVELRDSTVVFDTSNRSLQEWYNGVTKDSIVDYYKTYKNISFGVFETLVTRLVYDRKEFFRVVDSVIKSKYNYKFDFYSLRLKAQDIAYSIHKDKTTLDDIYEELAKLVSSDKIDWSLVRQAELDLEIELAIPRQDAVDSLDRFVREGSTVTLISDSYLPLDTVTAILDKCGVKGYSKLYLASETGLSKEYKSFWADYAAKVDAKSSIHFGNSFTADMQYPYDYKLLVQLLFNSKTIFATQLFYNDIVEVVQGSLFDSVFLGVVLNKYLCNSPFAFNYDSTLKELCIGSKTYNMLASYKRLSSLDEIVVSFANDMLDCLPIKLDKLDLNYELVKRVYLSLSNDKRFTSDTSNSKKTKYVDCHFTLV